MEYRRTTRSIQLRWPNVERQLNAHRRMQTDVMGTASHQRAHGEMYMAATAATVIGFAANTVSVKTD